MCRTTIKTGTVVAVLALLMVAAPAVQAEPLGTSFFTDADGFDVTYTLGGGEWKHHMTITSFDENTGEFTGKGFFIPNDCYIWEVKGVAGEKSEFRLDYTNCNGGYYMNHTGSYTFEGGKGDCQNDSQTCTWVTEQFHSGGGDCDEDGVGDDIDNCVVCDQKGGVVNDLGCTMDQLCPCWGYSNHGAYVSCLTHAQREFVDAGLLTKDEAKELHRAAAQSDCGK